MSLKMMMSLLITMVELEINNGIRSKNILKKIIIDVNLVTTVNKVNTGFLKSVTIFHYLAVAIV